ncbi:hypothetical protein D3C86_1404790 [compost metagenome]
MISKGRVCASRLEEHFIKSSSDYPSEYEFKKLFELHHGRVVWPLDLLRRRKSSHHPILFYTFLNCLDIDLKCLIEDCSDSVKYNSSTKPPTLIEPMEASGIERNARRKSFRIAYADVPAKDTGDYTWLYRHDRYWLQSYISGHRKEAVVRDLVDWTERDCELAESVCSAVAEISAMPGPPVQISLATICRVLSVPPDTFRHQHKLPQSMKAIKANLENRHDFQIRKLAWAASALNIENISRTKSNLLRKSNIRVSYLTEEEISRFMS